MNYHLAGARTVVAAVVLGLFVVGVPGVGFADPAEQPPADPATMLVAGNVSGGLQVTLMVPRQLPIDATDFGPGEKREVDMRIANTGASPYAGPTHLYLSSTGRDDFTPSVETFDAGTGEWSPVDNPYSKDLDLVGHPAVPAGNTVTLRYRIEVGPNLATGIRINASAGDSAVSTTVPVTAPVFTTTGMPGTVTPGQAYRITGHLTNPTDVKYSGLSVSIFLQACGGSYCVPPGDLLIEVSTPTGWHRVTVVAEHQQPGDDAVLLTKVTLPAAGSLDVAMRVTVAPQIKKIKKMIVDLGVEGLTYRGSGDDHLTLGSAIATPTPSPAAPSQSTKAEPVAIAALGATPVPDPATNPVQSHEVTATPTSSNSYVYAAIVVAALVLIALGGLIFVRARRR